MSGSTSSGNVIGSGSDSIILQLSEDSQAGVDAQFTLNVDGQQIGGRQSVTADHASGQDETFTFLGNYAPGPHNITVTFNNNFSTAPTGDRNVYVDSVNYDGQSISNTTTPIYQSPLFPPNSTDGNIFGNAVYTVNDTTPIPAGAPSTPTTTPGPVSIGSGADTLVLNMAEDPYQGDAQFTVAVDGQQVDGTQTTTASVEEGQQQKFDVHGNWGAGNHAVTVTFTNDQIGAFYPGTNLAVDTTDRNLYVIGMSLDGGPAAGGTPWEQATTGSHSFTVTSGSNQNSGSSNASSSSAANTSNTSSTDTSNSSSNNATITASSLGTDQSQTGSSSGMSFVASPATSASSNTPSSDAGSNTGSSTTDTAPSVATAISGTGQSPQDFTTPSSTDPSGATTSPVSGNGHQWWASQHDPNPGSAYFQNHG